MGLHSSYWPRGTVLLIRARSGSSSNAQSSAALSRLTPGGHQLPLLQNHVPSPFSAGFIGSPPTSFTNRSACSCSANRRCEPAGSLHPSKPAEFSAGLRRRCLERSLPGKHSLGPSSLIV